MQPNLTIGEAERFAELALACVEREYPNKIAHVLSSDADVLPPRKLTPAFYGCFDWHSSVHGHWLLVRLLRMFPKAATSVRSRAALDRNLTRDNLKQEAAYLKGAGRGSFERPYGLAWLLQLCAELHEWDDAQSRMLAANLRELEHEAVARVSGWLPKLSHAVRSGEHSQTAFALGVMLDYARIADQPAFATLLRERALRFFRNDRDAPLSYEPSGEDFLSPSLGEADLMRRVLTSSEYSQWLDAFLPSPLTLSPVVSADATDGKLAHLDGLNLSRAWMLEGVASALQEPRKAEFLKLSRIHAEAGVSAVTGEHYEGGHWLGTFAVYLLTQRGLF